MRAFSFGDHRGYHHFFDAKTEKTDFSILGAEFKSFLEKETNWIIFLKRDVEWGVAKC
jgi:hypothetical protein